ncbi:transposase [Streptomyces sp. NBC_01198]|nr:transposase [Streptomyces sp. NBC_01198]
MPAVPGRLDEEAASDVVCSFAVRHLAARGAVLVFDETGQEKKGIATAGVGRQYTGTTAVVAVYCTYASPLGHCSIDGDLFVHEPWTRDPDRREQAQLRGGFTFRTKTAVALEQARRAVAAGVAVGRAAGRQATRSPPPAPTDGGSRRARVGPAISPHATDVTDKANGPATSTLLTKERRQTASAVRTVCAPAGPSRPSSPPGAPCCQPAIPRPRSRRQRPHGGPATRRSTRANLPRCSSGPHRPLAAHRRPGCRARR